MRPACPCQAQAGTPPLLLPRPTADDSSHDNPILPESSSGHSPAFGILPRNEVQTGLFRSRFRPPAHARYVFKKYALRKRRESVGMQTAPGALGSGQAVKSHIPLPQAHNAGS